MNLPVFEGDRITMVIGVGNKGTDYTTQDASNLSDFATAVYPLLKAKL